MDIANLQAFVVVAECASFSAAADHLHLTQPAVSKRIAALESELDCRLFDRIGRRVTLTEAGLTLLARARRVLAELDDARRALTNLSGRVGGILRLATSHHVGLHRLPPVLRAFAGLHSEVQLDLRFTDSELACEAIGRGELELAVITLPPQAPGPALQLVPVWNDPLVIVTNPDHPLQREHRVSPYLLARHPAILPGDGTYTRRIVDRLFSELGIGLRVAFATNYMETIKMMVSVGLGWSLLPRTMLDQDVVELSMGGFGAHRTLGVVRHTGHTLSNAAKAMLGLLMDAGTASQSVASSWSLAP